MESGHSERIGFVNHLDLFLETYTDAPERAEEVHGGSGGVLWAFSSVTLGRPLVTLRTSHF